MKICIKNDDSGGNCMKKLLISDDAGEFCGCHVIRERIGLYPEIRNKFFSRLFGVNVKPDYSQVKWPPNKTRDRFMKKIISFRSNAGNHSNGYGPAAPDLKKGADR